jgi:hypothetical protein
VALELLVIAPVRPNNYATCDSPAESKTHITSHGLGHVVTCIVGNVSLHFGHGAPAREGNIAGKLKIIKIKKDFTHLSPSMER